LEKLISGSKELIEEIQEVIDKEINPLLQLHSGSISLQEVDDNGVIYVKLEGGCVGCPSSKLTLLNMVRPLLLEIEDVTEVLPA